MPTMFGNDRVLLYNISPWRQLGFGVPNFGDNIGTINQPVWGLVDEIGQLQLFIMTHIDAQRKQVPSRNTIERLGTMVNRVQTILSGRLKETNVNRLEEGHATGTQRIWAIHPVPYFDGPIVRNRWLKEYNSLAMIALANMMQHSDNNLALTVTSAFANKIWPFFAEIKVLMGTELLGLPPATVKPDTFVFTSAHYDAYLPAKVTIDIEDLDSPGPVFSRLTEDDLRPLLNGIPANLIAPSLVQYPIGPIPGSQGIGGEMLPKNAELYGNEMTAPAGGTTGRPADNAASGEPMRAQGGTAGAVTGESDNAATGLVAPQFAEPGK